MVKKGDNLAGTGIVSVMSSKSPRNRTLEVSNSDVSRLSKDLITLKDKSDQQFLVDKIINQDLLEMVDFLPDNFVDLLLVDPPYNLTKQYANSKFAKTSETEYEIWFENWVTKIKRCLKKDATIYMCSDWQTSITVQKVLERHFVIRNRITWEKEKGRGAKQNWKNCHEDIWFCTVSNDYYFDVEAVKLKRKVIAPYRSDEGKPRDWEETEEGNFRLTYPSNLWTDITLPFWSMPENTDHPTQKPEKLIAKLILASSKEGDLVFDPFMGSGTTCVVSKKLNRHFLGIEKELDYSLLALKRLEIASVDDSIQGYHDGFFWERNSLSAQNKTKNKKSNDKQRDLFNEE